jgi:hypothetical protein
MMVVELHTYNGNVLRIACLVGDAVNALEKLYSGRKVGEWDRKVMGWTAEFLENSNEGNFDLDIERVMDAAAQARRSLSHHTCYDTRKRLYVTLRSGINHLSSDDENNELRAVRNSLVDFYGGILAGLAFG